jgi:hypothetical protein
VFLALSYAIVGELTQCAVEYIEVYIAVDAWHGAVVGMLPEAPRAFVAEALDIVVGYP